MTSVLGSILPVFAIILAGWGARRMNVLGENAGRELNRFVVWLALPALLFRILAGARIADIWQPDFIACFAAGMMTVFVLTVAISAWVTRSLADAAIDGLNAAYPNNAYIGFPLCLAVIGPSALEPVAISSIMTACLLFSLGLIVIEVGLQSERHPLKLLGNVAKALSRNPLVVAPAAGALFLAFGIPLPKPADAFLTMLGGAASPCALVALGLFLAEGHENAPSLGKPAALVALKLVAQPALTWAAAVWVLGTPPAVTRIAVLIAALPTGTGPFMIAEFYRREAGVTSRTILISTIVSIATITLYLSVSA